MPGPKSNKLMSLRAAVVLLLALIVGVAVGALTYFGAKELPGAVLAGGGAFAAAVVWFDKIIAA
jgi:hypothetical protein